MAARGDVGELFDGVAMRLLEQDPTLEQARMVNAVSACADYVEEARTFVISQAK